MAAKTVVPNNSAVAGRCWQHYYLTIPQMTPSEQYLTISLSHIPTDDPLVKQAALSHYLTISPITPQSALSQHYLRDEPLVRQAQVRGPGLTLIGEKLGKRCLMIVLEIQVAGTNSTQCNAFDPVLLN